MHETSAIQSFLSYTGLALLLINALIMHRKGQSRSFHWFFTYLLFVAAKDPVLLVIHHYSNSLYFYCYWIGNAISIGLSFFVLYEIFQHVLTSGTLKVSKSTFALMNVVLLLVAAALALVLVQADKNATMRGILVLTRTIRIVQVGVMMILMVLSAFFGFYWSSQAFGIAAGFGFYAITEMVSTTVRSALGSRGDQMFSLATVISYQCAIVVWIVYAARGRKLPAMELPSDKVSVWSEPIERLIK